MREGVASSHPSMGKQGGSGLQVGDWKVILFFYIGECHQAKSVQVYKMRCSYGDVKKKTSQFRIEKSISAHSNAANR